MAPLRELVEWLPAPSNTLMSRQFSQTRDATTSSQLLSLMCISVSLASISVLAALYAFYWFVRMRRSFRQDLIMLLIQSDMMKAMWLVINPIVFFANSSISSNSTFCQVSGFFLTVTIEASDIAVLMIAVHTALFILKPQPFGGSTGLHPYRRYAYSLWAIIPITLASIVPFTGGSFADNGTYCYLPMQPRWYRSALSWIPRYIIFGFIIITYSYLYVLVYTRIRKFGRDQRRASTLSDPSTQRRRHKSRSLDVPHTPPILDHGLLDSLRSSLANSCIVKDRQFSAASTISTLQLGEGSSTPPRIAPSRRTSVTWNLGGFNQDGPTDTHAEPRAEDAPVSPTTQSFDLDTAPICAPEPVHHSTTMNSLQSTVPSWRRPLSLGAHTIGNSFLNLVTILRRGPSRSPNSISSCSSVHLPAEETEEYMQRSRERMQRHLSLLFVYPAIYMLTWIAPFVSQVRFRNTDDGQQATPFALQVVSMASLCIGAAVDCCFFSTWEKPWLHLRGGLWEGLGMRLKINRGSGAIGGSLRSGGGRTREERTVDARTAQARRDQETLDRLTEASSARTRSESRPREWWDVVDLEIGSTAHLA
ncbi:Uu.00g020880.m01.CDS01 [Anthostomella pinea]|uniref:Uu.00g020880.m01.CDS01 n=1 Tax=Anthostomella pinea TaxID=933095 RepID=A0AAI8YQR4_9PEZI|nr:Uu.00g020880.m01.CDS01 [Anthostomella pinea]